MTYIDNKLTLEEIAVLPALITAQQAALIVGVARKSIVDMCHRGDFAAFQSPGGHWRISTHSLLLRCNLENEIDYVKKRLGPTKKTTVIGRVNKAADKPLAKVFLEPTVTSESQEGSEIVTNSNDLSLQELLCEMQQLKEALTQAKTTPVITKRLTVSETASLANRSEETIRRLARSGKLPSHKDGNAWTFDRSEVLKYFDLEEQYLLA